MLRPAAVLETMTDGQGLVTVAIVLVVVVVLIVVIALALVVLLLEGIRPGDSPGSQADGNPPRLHAGLLPHQGCPPMGSLDLSNPDNFGGRTRGNVPDGSGPR